MTKVGSVTKIRNDETQIPARVGNRQETSGRGNKGKNGVTRSQCKQDLEPWVVQQRSQL